MARIRPLRPEGKICHRAPDSLQLLVLPPGLPQNRDVLVRVFPEREEILIGRECLGRVADERRRAAPRPTGAIGRDLADLLEGNSPPRGQSDRVSRRGVVSSLTLCLPVRPLGGAPDIQIPHQVLFSRKTAGRSETPSPAGLPRSLQTERENN